MKYRKKPVIIDAFQFFSNTWPGLAPSEFANAVKFAPNTGGYPTYPYIKTLEGRHDVTEGDWIIKGVKGEFYSCKPDIFEMTYEAVSQDDKGRE